MGIGTFVNRTAQPVAAPNNRSRAPTGDLILIAVVVALGILGLLMLYSASTDFARQINKPPTFLFNKQLIWMALGTVAAFVLASINYHHWRKFALPLMIFTVMALVAILFINDVRNNAVRSFIGGSIQPSELAKLATIIYLSVWLYSKREYLHDTQLGLIPARHHPGRHRWIDHDRTRYQRGRDCFHPGRFAVLPG